MNKLKRCMKEKRQQVGSFGGGFSLKFFLIQIGFLFRLSKRAVLQLLKLDCYRIIWRLSILSFVAVCLALISPCNTRITRLPVASTRMSRFSKERCVRSLRVCTVCRLASRRLFPGPVTAGLFSPCPAAIAQGLAARDHCGRSIRVIPGRHPSDLSRSSMEMN